MNRHSLNIDYIQSPKDHLDRTDALLVVKATEAAQNAYAPYSQFKVGAAVLLDNGHILTGSNQENASFPAGICAERSVIAYTHANYPTSKISAVAITASPCGICRQVLLESEKRAGSPIRVLLINENEVHIFKSVKDLIPFGFDSF
ncbi:MAG: cytidine deaminase [Bacteroidales bacterium]|nr:cytidine deaminase [Bacteroidales bacterium]